MIIILLMLILGIDCFVNYDFLRWGCVGARNSCCGVSMSYSVTFGCYLGVTLVF